jgi:hypothetical protein
MSPNAWRGNPQLLLRIDAWTSIAATVICLHILGDVVT